MTRPDPEELLAQAPWVHKLARRLLRDSHRAEDVAQETLALAVERRRAARPWLARVVHNLARRVTASEVARARREYRAARREGVDPVGDVAERIALHERLVGQG